MKKWWGIIGVTFILTIITGFKQATEQTLQLALLKYNGG